MTDEELDKLLKRYPALDAAVVTAEAGADLRRLMADQWEEAAREVEAVWEKFDQMHAKPVTDVNLVTARAGIYSGTSIAAGRLLERAAALRQSREGET